LVETDVLGKEELDQILRYGEKYSDDKETNAIYENMRAYKQEIFEQANDAYYAAVQSGAVKPYDYHRFYDHAVLKMYETCLKPIPIQNQKGIVKGSKAIGELIYPFDNSFGANVAREALNQLGVPYEDMDCSQLVKRAFYNLNEDWGKHGIGNHAGYQRNKGDVEWINSDGSIYDFDLLSGDLLYWENDQGETTHTAIYLGGGYMIEAWHAVRVTELREKTHLGGGEISTLVQVNRMKERKLEDNVAKYK
jgi:cell wall-associated NlpC family hydrolase